jgi:ribosomal protein L7Ae-like RNA K-turn-binding protein
MSRVTGSQVPCRAAGVPYNRVENELELGRHEGLVDHTKNTSTGTPAVASGG